MHVLHALVTVANLGSRPGAARGPGEAGVRERQIQEACCR